jgi:putative selenate reductase
VLAATLAARFLEATGGEIPVTFSAGVDATNFPTVLRAGISPVTTCTDLLQGKGYGKLCGYLRGLEAQLPAGGSLRDLPPLAPADWAAAVQADPRYHHDQNHLAPRKVGSRLVLLDCLTCDKCVPVCPNLAIQTFTLPTGEHPAGRLRWADGAWSTTPATLKVGKRHQIGIVADLCNRCGQCDPTCPEDGGPFAQKPNLFLDPRAWAEHPVREGFHVAAGTLWWRRADGLQGWTPSATGGTWTLPGGRVQLDPSLVPTAVEGAGEADLADAVLLRHLWSAFATADGWRPSPGASSP